MRRRERIGAAVLVYGLTLLIVASSGDTLRALAQGSAGSGAVAEAPTFKVGDEWQWTGGVSRRVTAIEGDLIVTPFSNRECQECRAYRDRNLTVVKLVDKGGNVVNTADVGYKTLDFPLTVGKQWESNQNLVNRRTGVAAPYKNAFAVEAYEDVKTKAGAFKAFRITHVQQQAHSSFTGSAGTSWRATLWYSPEVKAVVKREVNSRIEWGPDWELESYSLK